MHWRDRIAAHTDGREERSLSELFSIFSATAEEDRKGLQECLSVFEEEYDVKKGLLRPEDPLDLFLEPPTAKGPLRWLFGRAAMEDKSSELSYLLKRQRKRMGRVPNPRFPPATVGDYVDSWLGRD